MFQKIWVLGCHATLPHQGRVLSDGPTATMESGVLQLPSEAVEGFQLICDKLTLIVND